MARILTLTSDFGTRDAYVGAMKGVILGIARETEMVDISHEIGAQDVMEGAFVLQNAVPFFPPETVHLVVVDPGVGTDRRGVAVRLEDQFFVGADNGLFTLLAKRADRIEVVELDERSAWRSDDPSTTFHGRDIFAPAAAHLAAGRALDEIGTPVDDELEPLRWAEPTVDETGIRGWVVHVDRFGNCITNVPRSLFEEERRDRSVKLYAGSAVIRGIVSTYGAAEVGEPVALFGSSGFLEVALRSSDAAEELSIMKGDPVNVVFESEYGPDA